jgi:hypothetical protein
MIFDSLCQIHHQKKYLPYLLYITRAQKPVSNTITYKCHFLIKYQFKKVFISKDHYENRSIQTGFTSKKGVSQETASTKGETQETPLTKGK